MVQSIDKIHELLETTSIDVELFQLLSTMPDALKVEILHYAGYLLQKKSEVDIQDTQHDLESVEQEVVKKRTLFGCMKGTFVLPLPDDFGDPLENFEQSEKKYGYGSLAGRITMSDDFDEPLEDLKEYM
jgi:hypothetical protein